MALELQVLRTAKAALDEGLLNTGDYEVVKASFLRAQSIKAGVDAGFIASEDFAEARRRFFESLYPGSSGPSPAQPSAPPPVAATPPPATQRVAEQKPQNHSTPTPAPSSTKKTKEANGVGNTDVSPPMPPANAAPKSVPQLSIPSSPNKATSPTSQQVSSPSSTAPPTPADRGGAAMVAGKKSMAGIAIHEDSVNIVWELRVRKAYRWVIFRIGASGKQVEVEQAGAPDSTWEHFVSLLPLDQCRYGVFDYEYVNADGETFGKIAYVSWAPDDAPVKAKMQHASTKDTFRSCLEGVAVELNVSDMSELTEAELRERVAGTVARKGFLPEAADQFISNAVY